jgi:hypothetical protein
MTARKTHSGFYVTARDGSAGRTAWLLGPFATQWQALLMVQPTWRAIKRHSDDPRFAFAGFGTAKLTRPIEQPLPAGRFDMAWCDDDWLNDVINASRKEPIWSSPF